MRKNDSEECTVSTSVSFFFYFRTLLLLRLGVAGSGPLQLPTTLITTKIAKTETYIEISIKGRFETQGRSSEQKQQQDGSKGRNDTRVVV